MIQQNLQQILECQRLFDKYRSLADEDGDIIPLESSLYKTDPVINQHIMQMIDTDISWHEKTFGAIPKTTMQISKENSEKELIDLCNESHVMLGDLRLYKGEKEQKDCDNMMSESIASKAEITWPRKGFQTNEDEGVESAMMCWENPEDSEQEEKRRQAIGQDKDPSNDREMQSDEEADEEHVKCTVFTGN